MNKWDDLISLISDFVYLYGRFEVNDIPTSNVPIKYQHDITQFAIKTIEKLLNKKKNELNNLNEEDSKLVDGKNKVARKDHNIVEIREQIQEKEKQLELLNKSKIELRDHLEILKEKLDYIENLLQKRDMSIFKVEDVGILLRDIGLSKFENTFKQEGIVGVALKNMNEKHLIKLGMKKIYYRKRILHAIDLIQNYGILHPLSSDNLTSNWNVERVCEWLKDLGYEDKISAFEKAEINGVVLLHLSDEDLVDILKITKMKDRMRILDAIEILKISNRKVMDQLTNAI
jgi:hypothetical protein